MLMIDKISLQTILDLLMKDLVRLILEKILMCGILRRLLEIQQ